MNIVIDIVLLLAGFVLLIKGADFFVEGASSLARKLRIPSLVVGLTIVALGNTPWSYKGHTSSRLSGFDIHISAVFCNAYILRSFRRDHSF